MRESGGQGPHEIDWICNAEQIPGSASVAPAAGLSSAAPDERDGGIGIDRCDLSMPWSCCTTLHAPPIPQDDRTARGHDEDRRAAAGIHRGLTSTRLTRIRWPLPATLSSQSTAAPMLPNWKLISSRSAVPESGSPRGLSCT